MLDRNVKPEDCLVLDCETNDKDTNFCELRLIQIYNPESDKVTMFWRTAPSSPFAVYQCEFDDELLLPKSDPIRVKDALPESEVIAFLANNQFATQNGQYDATVLWRELGVMPFIAYDTMIHSRLIPSTMIGGNDLDSLMKRHVNPDIDKGAFGSWEEFYDAGLMETNEPCHNLLFYGGRDVKGTHLVLKEMVECYPKYMNRAYDVELALIPAIAKMQVDGLVIDLDDLEDKSRLLIDQMNDIKQDFLKERGKPLNLNSAKEIAEFLFEERNNTPIEFTNSGSPATHEGVLKKLSDPMASKISEGKAINTLCNAVNSVLDSVPKTDEEFSQLLETILDELIEANGGEPFDFTKKKELETFVFETRGNDPVDVGKSGAPSLSATALAKIPDPIMPRLLKAMEINKYLSTGKRPKKAAPLANTYKYEPRDRHVIIHPNWKPTSNKSSRMTCSPAIMGWPWDIRTCVVPRTPDRHFYYADISMAELMLLAYASKDDTLISLYNDRVDYHSWFAARLFDCDMTTVTSKQRESSKTVEYAIVYGSEGNSISEELDIPELEAVQYINTFFKQHPNIHRMKRYIYDEVLRTGCVTTPFGRTRRIGIPYGDDPESPEAKRMCRSAFNTYSQSGSGQIAKMVITDLYHGLPSGCQVLFSIYDSFLIEIPDPSLKPEIDEVMKQALCIAYEDEVWRFFFESGVGPNWLDSKKAASPVE